MKMNILAATAAFVFSAIMAGTVSCSTAPGSVITEARVTQGLVRGSVDRGVGTFMAIPFAEAPTGDLRWKAPVPKKAWCPGGD